MKKGVREDNEREEGRKRGQRASRGASERTMSVKKGVREDKERYEERKRGQRALRGTMSVKKGANTDLMCKIRAHKIRGSSGRLLPFCHTCAYRADSSLRSE